MINLSCINHTFNFFYISRLCFVETIKTSEIKMDRNNTLDNDKNYTLDYDINYTLDFFYIYRN